MVSIDALACLRPIRLAALLVLLGPVFGAAAAGPSLHEPWTKQGEVVSVQDGDTFDLRTADRGTFRVRLAASDSPETGQGYWRVARSQLQSLLERGSVRVTCYKDDGREREVCRVYTGTSDVGLAMVEAGLSWHFKRFESEQTAAERDALAQAESAARTARRGLWAEPEPMPPRECRAAKRQGGRCR
jgi:endonuclease YncB( thermonuclease family)